MKHTMIAVVGTILTIIGQCFVVSQAVGAEPWFRVGLANARDGVEPLMVGEGKDGYFVYVSQARVGQGRLLRICGLDVLTDSPERAKLLDAMFDYVRSDSFAPQATLPTSFLSAGHP